MHSNCCLLPGTKASENPTGWDELLPHRRAEPHLWLLPVPLSFSKTSWMQQEGAELEMGLHSHQIRRSRDFHSCCPQRPQPLQSWELIFDDHT